MDVDEIRPILMALYAAVDSPECEYAHQWEEGDLILSNNLVVAHRTGPGAHASVEEVGTLHSLRIIGVMIVQAECYWLYHLPIITSMLLLMPLSDRTTCDAQVGVTPAHLLARLLMPLTDRTTCDARLS